MEPATPPSSSQPTISYLTLSGIALVSIGVSILLDQYLKTGWLALLIILIFGLFMAIQGIRYQRMVLIIPGGIIGGLGLGSLLGLGILTGYSWPVRIGFLIIFFGMGWEMIALFSYLSAKKIAWWAFFVGLIIASIGATFAFSALRLVDFILFIGTGTAIAFIVWGVFTRLLGLIIPGCILIGIGPGVFLAWGGKEITNGLVETGTMLVWFALGWGLLVVFSKLVLDKFVWWPMIPGGILAVVGWGLYIGGNPGNALSFIGNTGSIALIILGFYLLFLRRGIRK